MGLFEIGRLVSTSGAIDLLNDTNTSFIELLKRHTTGDWGDLCEEDKQANDAAVTTGDRILSSYDLRGRKVWIITEADRSVTTLLLPEEY